MIDILLYSQNEDFKDDLENQIKRFINDCRFVEDSPDIIIIDNEQNTFESLRQKYPQTPIIFLNQTKEQTNTNLNIMIKKPLRLMNLLDAVRTANCVLDYSAAGDLQFNLYELRLRQKEIEDLTTATVFKLTEKEVNILKYLYKNFGKYVNKAELQANVWGYHHEVDTHTVETHIYRLRQKIEQSGRPLILTKNGQYQLVR